MNKSTYLYFPVRFVWAESGPLNCWFRWHGWQIGWAGLNHGLFGWTLHFGRFLILFGPEPTAIPAKYQQPVAHRNNVLYMPERKRTP